MDFTYGAPQTEKPEKSLETNPFLSFIIYGLPHYQNTVNFRIFLTQMETVKLFDKRALFQL